MSNNFTSIHHVSFIVSDLNKAKTFYCNVLGMQVDQSRPKMKFDGVWLIVNQHQQIHLLLVDNPDPLQRPEHGGRDRHAAFNVIDLNVVIKHLDLNNITYTFSRSGRKALFCRDPDGNTLEIMQ